MRLDRNEVTFALDDVDCVNCGSPMKWSDEFCEWQCPQCGVVAYQDETCARDEIYYEENN